MLLNKKLIGAGSVVSLKLVNGDELIARYECEDSDTITVSNPLAITAGAQGLGMIPWIFLGDGEKFTIMRNHVMAMVPSKSQAAEQYSQSTTSLVL